MLSNLIDVFEVYTEIKLYEYKNNMQVEWLLTFNMFKHKN